MLSFCVDSVVRLFYKTKQYFDIIVYTAISTMKQQMNFEVFG